MNILICYRNWMNPNMGGVQRVTDTLVKYFISQGHKLFYLTYIVDDKDTYPFPAIIYHLPDPDFFSRSNIDFYHNLLFKLEIEIVINNDSSNTRSKLWLNTGKHSAKKISFYHTDPFYGINKIASIFGDIRNPFLRDLIIRNFSGMVRIMKIQIKKRKILFLIKNSDKLVLLSDEFINLMRKEFNINSLKITAISNPCTLYGSQLSGIKKKQLLFVSRMEIYNKRPDRMLQIWAHLNTKYSDWELVFLGDGPDRNKIEEMARFKEIRNVRFEGFVDPVPYYKEASIVCMTSDYEGFGLVLVEAMHFGLAPIVFNNWASLKDIITDQETGILVECGNISEYVAKLDMLISNDVLRNRISSNAKEHSKQFWIETIGPKWEKLFKDLFNS